MHGLADAKRTQNGKVDMGAGEEGRENKHRGHYLFMHIQPAASHALAFTRRRRKAKFTPFSNRDGVAPEKASNKACSVSTNANNLATCFWRST